jgi:hypothetical protein
VQRRKATLAFPVLLCHGSVERFFVGILFPSVPSPEPRANICVRHYETGFGESWYDRYADRKQLLLILLFLLTVLLSDKQNATNLTANLMCELFQFHKM